MNTHVFQVRPCAQPILFQRVGARVQRVRVCLSCLRVFRLRSRRGQPPKRCAGCRPRRAR
jgi:hypothetical protein